MTLEDLLRRFRVLAQDRMEPYLAAHDDVVDWLNDAQAQACVRGRLLVAEGDPTLCQVELVPGQAVYKLHRTIYEIIDLRIVSAHGQVRPITLKTREWLDAERPGWRDYPRAACFAIQTDIGLRMVGNIEAGDVLHLEAYRLPLKKLASGMDKPEIHEAHHEHLIQWALHKAFGVPDSDLHDPVRAALAEQDFTAYFGPLPDSDLRRATRSDTAHHTVAVLP